MQSAISILDTIKTYCRPSVAISVVASLLQSEKI